MLKSCYFKSKRLVCKFINVFAQSGPYYYVKLMNFKKNTK